MGDQKNLRGIEAIEKMRKIILDEDICLFTTRLNQVPLDTWSMSASGVEEEGNIWFMSRENSSKNTDIAFMGRRLSLTTGTRLKNCGLLSTRPGLKRVRITPKSHL